MENEKRIAVLIDSDNVSAKYIRNILDELSKYGSPTYKRIYGDWTKPQLSAWKNILLAHSISPIQQYSYTVGKNATDSALIIDAMDILYSGNVDSFCIVSSDSDFTKIASRLREAGMYVIGMGEKKTPKPFISACDLFKYLEVLAGPSSEEDVPNSKNGEKNADNSVPEKQGMASKKDIEKVIRTIITATSDEDSWVHLGTVGNVLNKRYPDFDTRNYGYSKLSQFVASLSGVITEQRHMNNASGKQTFVKNKE